MTRKGTRKSRENQLTHQLTCRIPRAPCHCRTGSVVDVAATGFPVTDECSGLFLPLVHPSVSVLGLSSTCCCPWRGTRSYRHVCLPPLERAGLACSYCMRSQPRGGTSRMQQVLTLLDVLVHGHVLSRHTQRAYRPAGREGERRATR